MSTSSVSIKLKTAVGDGKDDFVIVDPKTGGLTLYQNNGQLTDTIWGWSPSSKEPIATGLGGPGTAVRLADMDGRSFLFPRMRHILTKVKAMAKQTTSSLVPTVKQHST